MIHNLADLHLDPAAAFSVVVSGHSHKPVVQQGEKVLFVNPGSAGPRRFTLPVTVATLVVGPARCDATIIELALSPPSRKRPGQCRGIPS